MNRPANPSVPRTTVAAFLLGVCLLVLDWTLPTVPVLGWLLSAVGTLAVIVGGISVTLWRVRRGDRPQDGSSP